MPQDPDDFEEDPVVRLRDVILEVASQAEEYTRRWPFRGLAAAFLAGLLLGAVMRKDR